MTFTDSMLYAVDPFADENPKPKKKKSCRKGMGIVEYKNPEPHQIFTARIYDTTSKRECTAGRVRWKVVSGSVTLYRGTSKLICRTWLKEQTTAELMKIKFFKLPPTTAPKLEEDDNVRIRSYSNGS